MITFLKTYNLKQYSFFSLITQSSHLVMFTMCLFLFGCEQQSKNITAEVHSDSLCTSQQKPFAYNICSIEQKKILQEDTYQLQLFWRRGGVNTDKSSHPLLSFNNLKNELTDGKQLRFATNAGMYNEKYAPIGYTVINEEQILSLNLNKGAGNFHLMPNGVFWWDDSGFYITKSTQMSKTLKLGTKPKFATQSGPMLVIKGKIHPAFKKNSTSKKMRNGVGICKDDTIKFVNSSIPINFYEFANLFKKQLKCDDALFFDGGIASAMYAPDIKKHDKKNMGVIVGLIEQNHIQTNDIEKDALDKGVNTKNKLN